jgi:hypothetical protein
MSSLMPGKDERCGKGDAKDEQERAKASETVIVDVRTKLNEDEQITWQQEAEDCEGETCPACQTVR